MIDERNDPTKRHEQVIADRDTLLNALHKIATSTASTADEQIRASALWLAATGQLPSNGEGVVVQVRP